MKCGINTRRLSNIFPKIFTSSPARSLRTCILITLLRKGENLITREHGCVFLMQIGDKLAGGKPHDGRAPDYDDWKLNGDILFWFEHLQCALEISSMGIRVDEAALEYQLKKAGCEDRRSLPIIKCF